MEHKIKSGTWERRVGFSIMVNYMGNPPRSITQSNSKKLMYRYASDINMTHNKLGSRTGLYSYCRLRYGFDDIT